MITFYHEAVEHLTRIHGAAKAFKGGADTFEYDTPSGHLVRPIEQVIKDEVRISAQPPSAVRSDSVARYRRQPRVPPLVECHVTHAGTCGQGISSDS
jgi:thiamine biosynthesis protein ThiC